MSSVGARVGASHCATTSLQYGVRVCPDSGKECLARTRMRTSTRNSWKYCPVLLSAGMHSAYSTGTANGFASQERTTECTDRWQASTVPTDPEGVTALVVVSLTVSGAPLPVGQQSAAIGASSAGQSGSTLPARLK